MAETARETTEESPGLTLASELSGGEVSRWDELDRALERARGGKLLIPLVGYPDPDNIASGLALEFLAAEYDIETTLLTFHDVSHQENRALVKRLDVHLVLWEEGYDLSPFPERAFFFGGVQVVRRDPDGALHGAADSRRGGAVIEEREPV